MWHLELEPWDLKELHFIGTAGFEALNLFDRNGALVQAWAEGSFGAPFIMQQPASRSALLNQFSVDFTSLMNDLENKIFDLFDDATVIHPGHGDDSTLGTERPHLAEWRNQGGSSRLAHTFENCRWWLRALRHDGG